jgi:hypothetical protein
VRKLNLHEMYILGKRLAPLGDLDSDFKISEQLFNLWFARSALQEMLVDESPLLEAAKRAARSLITSITDAVPAEYEKAQAIDKEDTLGMHAYRIKREFTAFESVIANEMPGVSAYIASQKGLYRTEDLIDHAERHFPVELQKDLPIQTQLDLREAGKSLAFGLPTACSFHLWRALESVIDAYYIRLTSSSFDADKVSANWGAKIKALAEKGADIAATKFLDHIREQYRNPQTHPEEMVELNDALMLFGAAGSAIKQIVCQMQRIVSERKPIGLLAGGRVLSVLTSPEQSS